MRTKGLTPVLTYEIKYMKMWPSFKHSVIMCNFSTVLKNFHNLPACHVIHHMCGIQLFNTMLTEATMEFIPHFQTPYF